MKAAMKAALDPASLADVLAELAARHGVPGAQLALQWADRLVTVETGEAVAGSGLPVTAASTFPLGSLTKPFTATLAMMLVADGDVELDEPLTEHLPELRRGSAAGITLRQVLSHTGGLAANAAELPPGATRARWLDRHAGELAVHKPGTVFSYSNPGYLIAGSLVEVITGMTWQEALRSMLLRPLGRNGGFVAGPPEDAAMASGHLVRPDGAVRPIREQSVPPVEEPAAGLAVSAADLAAFGAAHLAAGPGAGLLDPATARAMREDALDGLAVGAHGLADGWGLGWSLYRTADAEWFGHDGTGDGAWSHLRVHQATGTILALTANGSTGAWLWEALLDWLRAAGLDVGDQGRILHGQPQPCLSECAGDYANGSWSCRVEARGSELWLSVAGSSPVQLSVFGDLSFCTEVDGADGSERAPMPYTGRFLRDPATGRVDLLQITGRLARRQD